ncbi:MULTISPECIES: hypothetical protein [unclassified Streptomyces]|uniref:hypothetical protein n=1 Tax=unclassified Streptomyces TaxID=2593676 RepID=UPI0003719018|nr:MULTISPECIES: hypothetical protein [unclassified Streptomyces]MYT29608.1 hypothetical protein [Streptomyces sp. SID8354]
MTFKVFFPRNRKTDWDGDCDDWGRGRGCGGYGHWRRGGWRGDGGVIVIIR